MQNININLNPDDLLDISSQVPIKTGMAQQVTNVSDVLTGPQGPRGPQGETGPAGPAGPAGPRGETGPAGPAGPQGIQGETGPAGPEGPAGPRGETGATGQSANISVGTVTTLSAGSDATVVNSGTSMDAILDFGIPQGVKGDTGETGPAGPRGETGPAGPEGPRGETGPAGPAGPRGETGPAGPAGPAGPRGETGPAGPEGPAGPRGETGPAGPEGPRGETGPAGPQGETGPAGPQGIQGETGPAGVSATIAVGTVTTLPAGSNATVTNSGTSSSAVFDFGIPKGESGSSTVTYVSAETAIGKWIDGKTIYRRVVSGTYNSVVGITNLFTIQGVSKLIKGYGHIKNVDCILLFGQNHWSGSTIINSSYALIAGGNLIVRSYNTYNSSSLPYEIVLEYIK